MALTLEGEAVVRGEPEVSVVAEQAVRSPMASPRAEMLAMLTGLRRRRRDVGSTSVMVPDRHLPRRYRTAHLAYVPTS